MTFLDRPSRPQQGRLENGLSSPGLCVSGYLRGAGAQAACARARVCLGPGSCAQPGSSRARQSVRSPASNSNICSGQPPSIPLRDALAAPASLGDGLISDNQCSLTSMGPSVGHRPWPEARAFQKKRLPVRRLPPGPRGMWHLKK